MSDQWLGLGPSDHVLMDLSCPCQPTIHLCCDVCNSQIAFGDAFAGEGRVSGNLPDGCWKCEQGFGEQITQEQALALPDDVLILVRHAMDDDDEDEDLEPWQRT